MMKTIPQEFLMEDGLVQLIDGFTEKGGVQENFVKKQIEKGADSLPSMCRFICNRRITRNHGRNRVTWWLCLLFMVAVTHSCVSIFKKLI